MHDVGIDAVRDRDLRHRCARRLALGQDLRLQLRRVPPTFATSFLFHRVQLFAMWTGSLLLRASISTWDRRTLTIEVLESLVIKYRSRRWDAARAAAFGKEGQGRHQAAGRHLQMNKVPQMRPL